MESLAGALVGAFLVFVLVLVALPPYQLVQHAQDLGWSIDRIGLAASGSTIGGSRALTNVRSTVGSQVQGGEPIEASLGRITVSRDEPRRAGLFWSSLLLGAVGGAWLGHRV
jgi:hypothetical protein